MVGNNREKHGRGLIVVGNNRDKHGRGLIVVGNNRDKHGRGLIVVGNNRDKHGRSEISPTRCNNCVLFSAMALLYMFRVTISLIIRSTYAVYGHR